jgi:GNAT superfamily N-acetyltransferase
MCSHSIAMPRQVLFDAGPLQACELAAADVPALQHFFDENPAYFIAVNGQPAGPQEAQIEFDDLPPEGMPFRRRWVMGFVDRTGRLQGMAHVLGDFLATGVWHVGLFIVATPRHGDGSARSLYGALERWMTDNGARWVRLGAVLGNARAERFWERCGYTELRRRHGVSTGILTHTIRVFAKPTEPGRPFADYLALVPRDHPDSLLT